MISNISYTRPFLDVLADSLLLRGKDLWDDVILLPSNRACLSLRNTLLSKIKNSLFLPAIQTAEEFLLEDADPSDVQKIIGEEERLFLMTRLLIGKGERPEKAIGLARTLLRLVDELESSDASLSSLKDELSGTLTRYFDEILGFLGIVTTAWPLILRERGQVSALSVYKKSLALNPLKSVRGKIIAAGFRTSDPVLLSLLKQIADDLKGELILYGAFQEDKANEMHPTFEAKKMKEAFFGKDGASKTLPEFHPEFQPALPARLSLIEETMRPAETTDKWLDSSPDSSGLSLLTLKDDNAEAKAIALLIKERLLALNETVMVVTENKILSRKIAAESALLGITVNASAGMPLLQTTSGVFFALISELMHDGFRPDVFLALLKHPLYVDGKTRKETIIFAEKTETLLRDNRKSKTVTEEGVLKNLRNLFSAPKVSFETLLKAHIDAAEALATSSDRSGKERLYLSEEGQALKEALDLYLPFAKEIGDISPFDYAALFTQILSPHAARTVYSQHPRVRLLGPIEAHLETADTVILADLNEGSFPKETIADPFFNRTMRKVLALTLPEEALGREAHMFSSCLGKSRVILSRALKKEGKQQTCSRWLLRLRALLKDKTVPIEDTRFDSWLALLDTPDGTGIRIGTPKPAPGKIFRPSRLSLTDIERWMKDPYSIYCKYILNLRPLDDLSPPMLKQKYGTLIHAAIEQSLKNPNQSLEAIGLALFKEASISLFWQSKFKRIAVWFSAQNLSGATTEASVEKDIGGIIVKGRADAVLSDTVIDYKTGVLPKKNQIITGDAPQLPLLAFMIGDIYFLEYWHLTGEDDDAAGKIVRINKTADEGKEIIERTLLKVTSLFDSYTKDDTPYIAPISSIVKDYEHLSRRKEWSRL